MKRSLIGLALVMSMSAMGVDDLLPTPTEDSKPFRDTLLSCAGAMISYADEQKNCMVLSEDEQKFYKELRAKLKANDAEFKSYKGERDLKNEEYFGVLVQNYQAASKATLGLFKDYCDNKKS